MERVLLIEDEPNIADFVKTGLEQNGYVVSVAHTGSEGLQLFHAEAPDLVVLDLMLPDSDGIEICRQIRGSSDACIIILTARQLVGDRVRGLDAGADDYLPKPFAFEELLARIRSVMRRRAGDQGRPIKIGDLEVSLDRREVRRGDRTVDLTNKEFELLALLARNAGRPVRRDLILERIWGYAFDGGGDPVKVYVNYLRKKLNARGQPDLIQAIRGFGYVLRETV